MLAEIECKAVLHAHKMQGFASIVDGGVGNYELVYNEPTDEALVGIVNFHTNQTEPPVLRYNIENDGIGFILNFFDAHGRPTDQNFTLKVI